MSLTPKNQSYSYLEKNNVSDGETKPNEISSLQIPKLIFDNRHLNNKLASFQTQRPPNLAESRCSLLKTSLETIDHLKYERNKV